MKFNEILICSRIYQTLQSQSFLRWFDFYHELKKGWYEPVGMDAPIPYRFAGKKTKSGMILLEKCRLLVDIGFVQTVPMCYGRNDI